MVHQKQGSMESFRQLQYNQGIPIESTFMSQVVSRHTEMEMEKITDLLFANNDRLTSVLLLFCSINPHARRDTAE